MAKFDKVSHHDSYNITYKLNTAAFPNILFELRDINAIAEVPSRRLDDITKL